MQNPKKFFVLTLTVLLSLALVSTAFAQPRGRRGKGLKGGPQQACLRLLVANPEVAEEIGLSSEDVDRLREMFSQHRKEMIDVKAGLEKAEAAMREEMEKAQVDAKTVRIAAKNLADAHGKMIILRAEHQLAVHQIVSYDQMMKLRAMVEERRGQRGGRGNGPDAMGWGPPDDE